MRFLAPLLRSVLAVVVGGALLTGYVVGEALAAAPGLRRALASALGLACGAQLAIVAAVLVRAARP
ncbi:MAG TPA: hypothetical protein VF841_10645, partial [Anaeromyxobacter sp.]